MNFFQSLPRLALCLAAVAGLLAGGCANRAVIFATTTRTAVEISAAEGGQQGVHVGFDRFEGVMMPLVHTNHGGQTVTLAQAYPVYAEYEYATGGLTPASATNGSALVLRQVFATGRAATNVAVQRQVSADFQALQGSYVADDAGDRLRCFWKPDGTNPNPGNTAALTAWMNSRGVGTTSITFFLQAGQFAEQRKLAVRELNVPACPE